MADLTPELLERLEYLAALKTGLDNESDETRDHTSGEMLRAVSLEFMDHATSLVAAAKELARVRDAMRRLIADAEEIRIESTGAPYLPKMVHASDIQEVLDGRAN